VYYHITRFYNKTLTFISFFVKIIGNYVILYWYAISTSKIIMTVLVLETNTGDVGGFLQVQHYWGVNIHCELLNPELWMIHWSHYVPTTKLTPFVVSKDEYCRTQRRALVSPWRMYCMYFGVPKDTLSDVEQKKNQAHSLIHYRVTPSVS